MAEPGAARYRYRITCHECCFIAIMETKENANRLFLYHQSKHRDKNPKAVEMIVINQPTLGLFGE